MSKISSLNAGTRRLIAFCTLIIFLFTTPSCTHNGGDLDGLFGTWHLNRITIDGQTDEAYTGDIIWKFQYDIIAMMPTNDEEHLRFEGWGTWSFDPTDHNILLLHYIHHDDKHPAGSSVYSPLPATHLPAGEITLIIDRLTSSSMQLTYKVPDSSSEIVYFFTKW